MIPQLISGLKVPDQLDSIITQINCFCEVFADNRPSVFASIKSFSTPNDPYFRE